MNGTRILVEDVIPNVSERFALDIRIRMDNRAWTLSPAAESRDLAIDGLSSRFRGMSRYLS